MRKYVVGPASPIEEIMSHLLNVPVTQPATFYGFDENVEGAEWIAVVQCPCGNHTHVWAVDDHQNSIDQLIKFYEHIGDGLRVPFRPSNARSKLLGIYRKVD